MGRPKKPTAEELQKQKHDRRRSNAWWGHFKAGSCDMYWEFLDVLYSDKEYRRDYSSFMKKWRPWVQDIVLCFVSDCCGDCYMQDTQGRIICPFFCEAVLAEEREREITNDFR